MQPYFFPYIGYIELVRKVDLFIFYDDAAFSKNSWFNRNRIFSPGKEFEYIRVAVSKAPLGTPVGNIKLAAKDADLQRSLSILTAYAKSPNYEAVRDLVIRTFTESDDNLSRLASQSVLECSRHMGLDAGFMFSSELDYDRTGSPLDKVLDICRAVGATEYVNLSGGMDLYDSEVFAKRGFRLSFTMPSTLQYESDGLHPVPNLSIIDPMMRCTTQYILDYFRSRD
jgi:hypothetical protein